MLGGMSPTPITKDPSTILATSAFSDVVEAKVTTTTATHQGAVVLCSEGVWFTYTHRGNYPVRQTRRFYPWAAVRFVEPTVVIDPSAKLF